MGSLHCVLLGTSACFAVSLFAALLENLEETHFNHVNFDIFFSAHHAADPRQIIRGLVSSSDLATSLLLSARARPTIADGILRA